MDKTIFIIGGCNGAGKTTASFTLMPHILDCHEFINADEIARGISPFHPEKVSFEAGRIMLRRIKDLISKDQTFAFESTLATKSYKNLIIDAKLKSYKITLVYFWLENVELAIERVATRVKEGGHDIPSEVIKRRYTNGLKNLFEIYIPLSDSILIFDNTYGVQELIAEQILQRQLNVLKNNVYEKLRSAYDRIN